MIILIGKSRFRITSEYPDKFAPHNLLIELEKACYNSYPLFDFVTHNKGSFSFNGVSKGLYNVLLTKPILLFIKLH